MVNFWSQYDIMDSTFHYNTNTMRPRRHRWWQFFFAKKYRNGLYPHVGSPCCILESSWKISTGQFHCFKGIFYNCLNKNSFLDFTLFFEIIVNSIFTNSAMIETIVGIVGLADDSMVDRSKFCITGWHRGGDVRRRLARYWELCKIRSFILYTGEGLFAQACLLYSFSITLS